jgi:hypothetical protein
MTRHFPYVAAATVTAGVGVATTCVWGAQAPAHAPVILQPSPPHAAAVVLPNMANTPGIAAAIPIQTAPTTPTAPAPALPFAPGNVAQIVGVPGNPAGALVPGIAQASHYAQPAMNQPGQPPFGEMLYSMQTYMNQPGVQDFYTTYNPAVVQASEGITPSAAYPNASTPQTGVPSAAAAAIGSPLTQGPTAPSSAGFFNGFGPGQTNWGFYAGFTAPR